MKFAYCCFCRNRAGWLLAGSDWQLCTSCRKEARLRHWDELARRWLRCYPEDWVDDVAEFISKTLADAGPESAPN